MAIQILADGRVQVTWPGAETGWQIEAATRLGSAPDWPIVTARIDELHRPGGRPGAILPIAPAVSHGPSRPRSEPRRSVCSMVVYGGRVRSLEVAVRPGSSAGDVRIRMPAGTLDQAGQDALQSVLSQ